MKYADSPEALEEARKKIEAAPWAAVDTEADSLHHYREKLCLVQIGIPSEDYVLDPLKPWDLAPIVRALEKKPLLFHGADFDVRMLRRFYGFTASAMFDTMIAAQVLGYEKQGYADLARIHCDVELSKKAQRADWSERPLTEELLAYASNDTHYLKTISDRLRDELREKGRLEWHRQFCERVLASALTEREPKLAAGFEWQVKGSKDLPPPALTVLRELWLWREQEAQRRDRPVFKVLHTETLVEIADWAAKQGSADVSQLPSAPRNVKNELRNPLNAVIAKAKSMPPTPYTAKKPDGDRKRWTNHAETLLKKLKEAREALSKEHKIHPSLIATNAVLEEFCMKPPKTQEEMAGADRLMPWQAGLAAESFLQVLHATN